MTAILVHGGRWENESNAGIARREMNDLSSNISSIVASSSTKNYYSYTDEHDVDEALRTILIHGADWPGIAMAGIVMRDMQREASYHANGVASYVCEHHLLYPNGYHNVGYKIPTDQSIHMYPYLYKFS